MNKHFRDKKKNRYKNRVNDYLEKTCVKNGSVEKWECSYNIYKNKKEEEKKDESKKSIEELQIKKYAQKCNFKSKGFYSILDLKIDKDNKIKLLKIFRKIENYFESKSIGKTNINQSKFTIKKKELIRILNEIKCKLESEGHNSDQLKTQIQKIYNQYKHKPHFIIESNKYGDLDKIIKNIKKTVENVNKHTKEEEKSIRNNIFSILLEQVKHKVDIPTLIPMLKKYLDKQNKLEYNKVFNNHYYYELLELVKNKGNYLRLAELEKIVT
ncbi:plasmid maintenance protein [Borrelia miyamotoi]|uniref:plasmid maintenance protein n=1 Tax=Borrelia miyamotoi TaxID=47466 RepID=UPI002FBE59C1